MSKKNIIILWFRNDLRLRDNEALYQATQNADYILPIYCLDPRQFKSTNAPFSELNMPKTGALRAKFLLESLQDLRFSLRDLGSDLIIRTGKPEEIIFALAKYHQVKAVYFHEEATAEEIEVEERLEQNLAHIGVDFEPFWGSTLYHFDDLPQSIDELPDMFTNFRKQIEKKGKVRPLFPIPEKIALLPEVSAGELPTLQQLGVEEKATNNRSVLAFKGGETAALLRLKHYFWEGDYLQFYKETRNGLLGADYSSKFSPWLSNGCLSARYIYEEVKKYEEHRIKNDSTYWMVFELLWRDYFRFIAMKYGNDIFKTGGIKQISQQGQHDAIRFKKWCQGQTGIPFVDANMRELTATGFMSNRGRQNVASFLAKDLNIDWRWGAAYFESKLLDYDPCSNYGNWNYVAGIGNDPRENRYFNVLVQAKRYDPKGKYVKFWCPELKRLPSTRIHEPYLLNETEQKYLGVQIGQNYPAPCLDIQHWKARRKFVK